MGKLIVHWSPLHGQAKTTSSMGALAISMCLTSGDRVCLTSTQYNMSDLEGMFDNRMSTEKKQLVYQAAGLSALITNIKRDKLSKEDVEDCSMPTAIKNVELLPGVELQAGDSADEETDRLIYKIITESVKECYDWTFVDLAAGNVPQSMRFIEAADIVVVTLSQNQAMWHRFFEKYEHIAKKENVFYLIGGSKQDSAYTEKNLVRMYQNDNIRYKNSGSIPDCVGYMDAISDGLVPDFFMMNRKATKKEENGDFIKECADTAAKLKAFLYTQRQENKKGRGE